nr:WAT1-related protein At1g09380-like [Ipomoea batatas]
MGADLLALMMMIFVQFGYAVMNIISKVAMDSGMNPFVHVAYRQLFASIAIAPIAYFYERISLNQITYFVGLKNSTPTIACALTNLIPAVTYLMAVPFGIQCVVFAVCFDHKPIDWSLRQGIRATSTVYAGIMGTAIAYCLMSWCIDKKGPLYVSVFNPLLLVIVAVLSWGLLRDKIYVGTIVGSVLIVVGLYGVLWGKQQELRQVIGVVDVDEEEAIDEVKTKEDNLEELELSGHSIITVDQFPKK